MRRFARWAACSSLLLCVFAECANSQAGETIRPMRTIQAYAPETWIGSRTDNEDLTWVVVYRNGLKRINVASGNETTDEFEAPCTRATYRARLISADGTRFAFIHSDRRWMTFARVSDGRTILKARANELFGERQQNWPGYTYLSEDGTYCICLYTIGRRSHLDRVDLIPEPRIVATHEFANPAQSVAVADDGSGLAITNPSGISRRSGDFFKVFDREFHLQHKQPVQQPWCVHAIVTPADGHPLVLLAYPEHNHWQVVRRTRDAWMTYRSGHHVPQRGFSGILAASISPDGKWVVTSPISPQPTLGIWSLPDGELHRELYLEGGLHPLPSDRTITHLRFSKSGEYLSASDHQNAYLLRFSDLIKEQSSD